MVDATLVTIHGFWSSPGTWDRLDAIWNADKQLYGLRICPFGYSSPKKPRLPFSAARIPDYDDIAQTLATEYRVGLAEASAVAIVTHSQGGLIMQRFLTWMLQQGHGRELVRTRSIVMLACPNGGSEYLRSIRRVLGFGRHPQAGSLQVLDRQVADTQRTVLQRIVNATSVDDYQCRIPLHVYAGASDKIVTAASAQGAFPEAAVLAGDHSSILDPAAPGNRTAATVKHHLLADLTVSPAPAASSGHSVQHGNRDTLQYGVSRDCLREENGPDRQSHRLPSVQSSSNDLEGLEEAQICLLRETAATLNDLLETWTELDRTTVLSANNLEVSSRMQHSLNRTKDQLLALERKVNVTWRHKDWVRTFSITRAQAQGALRNVEQVPYQSTPIRLRLASQQGRQFLQHATELRRILNNRYPSLFQQ